MKELKIENIDKNLAVSDTIDAPDLRLYDVRKPPFKIYGLYRAETEPEFRRVPDDVAAATSENVQRLARNTAGGRVRFSTDSPYIAIKAVMPSVCHLSHMPLSGTSGFDIYIDSPDGRESVYHRTFVPPYNMKDGYESKVEFYEAGTHYVTINFPLYNALTELYVGVSDKAFIGEGAPYRDMPPIVYYGSSITQGGCASHPGNSYQAMITRTLGIDHVNLGFSGSGKGEDAIIDYMAGLTMSAFVADYDHNSPNPEHLCRTHRRMYDAVRAAHPDIPYVLLSRTDFFRPGSRAAGPHENIDRRHVIAELFRDARVNGDKNVYYVDGEGIFRGFWEDCCTVDGVHPNDLGFSLIAEALIPIFRRILKDKKM